MLLFTSRLILLLLLFFFISTATIEIKSLQFSPDGPETHYVDQIGLKCEVIWLSQLSESARITACNPCTIPSFQVDLKKASLLLVFIACIFLLLILGLDST